MSWHPSTPFALRLLVLAMLLIAVLAWTKWRRPVQLEPNVAAAAQSYPAHSAGPADERNDAVDSRFAERRLLMVAEQMRSPPDRRRAISDPRVLEAMGRVPRHLFVPKKLRDLAYADRPLPIGEGQTISQPYIVALMTEVVRPQETFRALDVGTGSGYQAAILAELVADVYSIEIVASLAQEAADRLVELNYENIEVRQGDGYRGWPEYAPFDVIIVAAAPTEIPQPLIDQLAPGGRLVIPVGGQIQELVVVEKLASGDTRRERITGVRFVPMTGQAQRR